MLQNNLIHCLIVAIAVGGCTNSGINTDVVCNTAGCISIKKFSANINAQLSGKVVGYVSLIGAVPVISKFGAARTAADPPALGMDTDIPSNVASISKVLTTIGVLQSLAKHSLTIDSKIAPFLPPDWVHGPNIDAITFRELLTHHAGFRDPSIDYAGMKQEIADGVLPADKSTGSYSNLNFALFRILLPFMEGFSDPGAATRPDATAAFYVRYMKQNVFQPLGITGANCKPPSGVPSMLSYPPPPVGAAHGTDLGDWTAICGGGGWVVSAGDLFKILIDIGGGHLLLTDAQKAEMNTNCLGWDCSVQTQTDFIGKNGRLPVGSQIWLWTFMGMFKGSIPVVLIVNSDTPGTANITGVVTSAFANATVPHP